MLNESVAMKAFYITLGVTFGAFFLWFLWFMGMLWQALGIAIFLLLLYAVVYGMIETWEKNRDDTF